MHIIVSWDIKNVEYDEWDEINNSLRNCIKRYSWVRPLSTFYIIKIDTEEDRKYIRDAFINICKENKRKINIVISPVMLGGKYSGWLPHNMWDEIKERTAEDFYYE